MQQTAMPTFAPVAIAGNLPELPADTVSRTIRVLLLPDIDGIAEESDWEAIEPDVKALRDRVVEWANSVREDIRKTRPDLPEGITGRLREKWAPLRRVADAAGGRWPELVDRLAVEDKEQIMRDRGDGLRIDKPHIVLLQDLAEYWPQGEDFVATHDLVAKLAIWHPEMWSAASPFGKSLTAQRFGRMLVKNYKISSSDPLQRGGPRGYYLKHFTSAMQHLGIRPPSENL